MVIRVRNTSSFASKDDALTALIHLGYLRFYAERNCAFILHDESATAFDVALQIGEWKDTAKAISICDEFLDETI